MSTPGIRGPVFAWAARYSSLAVNADRLHRRRTGRSLVAYTGPRAWVTEWEREPIPSTAELRELADELLTSITEIDLGAPADEDFVTDEELVKTLRESIAAVVASLEGTEVGLLVVDIDRVFRAGTPWL